MSDIAYLVRCVVHQQARMFFAGEEAALLTPFYVYGAFSRDVEPCRIEGCEDETPDCYRVCAKHALLAELGA